MQTQDLYKKMAIQSELFEILKIFKKICEKHNLRYYMAYGSLLGIIRHQGFIPWDDDMDVIMPRKDYERFLKISQEELKGSNIGVVDYDSKIKNYHAYIFIKINGHTWPMIDIMPLDGTFSLKILRDIHLWICDQMALAFWQVQRQDESQKTSKYRRIRLKVITLIFGNFLANRTMHFIRSIKKYDDCFYVHGFAYGRDKEVMPKTWFGNGTKKVFLFGDECEYFYCPDNSHAYLKQIYGKDYMQLPPEKERCGHYSSEDLKIFDKKI